MYALLFFVVYASYLGAMEEIYVGEVDKKNWHEQCVRRALEFFLKENYKGLSYEIIGSKKFIALELRKKLDNKNDELDDVSNGNLCALAQYRNDTFLGLKRNNHKRHSSIIHESIEGLAMRDIKPLLPFMVSLQQSIQNQIERNGWTTEIEWKKKAYIPFSFHTGFCKHTSSCTKKDNLYMKQYGHCEHVQACLDLDIENGTIEELQSDVYDTNW